MEEEPNKRDLWEKIGIIMPVIPGGVLFDVYSYVINFNTLNSTINYHGGIYEVTYDY